MLRTVLGKEQALCVCRNYFNVIIVTWRYPVLMRCFSTRSGFLFKTKSPLKCERQIFMSYKCSPKRVGFAERLSFKRGSLSPISAAPHCILGVLALQSGEVMLVNPVGLILSASSYPTGPISVAWRILPFTELLGPLSPGQSEEVSIIFLLEMRYLNILCMRLLCVGFKWLLTTENRVLRDRPHGLSLS